MNKLSITNKEIIKLIKTSWDNWATNPHITQSVADKILNIKFLNGDQYAHYDSRRHEIVRLPFHDVSVTPVVSNWMLPFAESVKARIVGFQPRPHVFAGTRDHGDKVKALKYTQILKGAMQSIDFDDKLQEMVDIMLACKGVFLRPFWNKEIKSGQWEGEVDFDIWHDLNIIKDPLAVKANNMRYLIKFDPKSLRWAKEKYPKFNFKKEPLIGAKGNLYRQIFMELEQSSIFNTNSLLLDLEETVTMFQFMYKDNKGKMKVVKVIQDQVVETIDIPFEPIYIPYYKNSFSREGRSPLSGLRMIQREINDTLTRVKAESRKTAKMLKHTDCEISENNDTWDQSSNEIVEYYAPYPHMKPEIVQPPQFNVIDVGIWSQQFAEVGGLQETSRGKLQSSQLSKVALQFLAEQDETKIGNAKINLRVGLTKTFRNILDLIDKNYQPKRVVNVLGRKKGWKDPIVFEKLDNRDVYDVTVEIGGVLPTTPAARAETVLTFNQAGMFEDVPNKPKYLRELIDLMPYDIDDIDQDFDHQEYETEQMLNGNVAVVKDTDNHVKHIESMMQFIKTKSFEDQDPIVRQMLFIHLEQHAAVAFSSVGNHQNLGNLTSVTGQDMNPAQAPKQ